MMSTPWTIDGAEGRPIRGDAHAPLAPHAPPRAVVLLAHGFKGYKDYGFIPALAQMLAAALPVVVHRFNFSHSGVGEDPSTFEHPELFERDTWNKQAHDIAAVMDAAHAGRLPKTPPRLPIILIGHSRGGVSCLLAAGRRFRDAAQPTPRAIITIAAPATAAGLSEDECEQLLERGFIETKSARTGQTLRIGAAWLREQYAAPEDHDVEALCARIDSPVLAIHGAMDPTVPPPSARVIERACPRGRSLLIDGADHVFNTPNPADPDATPSPQLATLQREAVRFLSDALGFD
ncbi:MAG: alpha/beta hydrolase [Phycisphaeraceae bacterium]|nr:MAG: alpha/beta hydrolase [Phycisphaeraceae bacterium]